MLYPVREIILLLCIIASSYVFALEKAKFSKELSINVPNSITLPYGNQLYTVSKNRSHVNIESMDENYKPCAIRVDAFDDLIRGKMRAFSFDSEIFLWGERSKQIARSATKFSNYTLLLLNPNTCNYLSASINEQDEMPAVGEQLPEVVNYGDKFDVFFPSLTKCSPCRYNQWGVKDDPSQQPLNKLRAEEPHSSIFFHIRWMNPGYFYVFNFENGTSVLRYLDQEFFTLKEKYVDRTVDVISNTVNKTRNVGVCYRRSHPVSPEIFCTKLNSQLHSLDFFRVPVSKSSSVSSMSFEYDKKGHSFVGLAEYKQYELFIYDKNGQLVKSLDFGKAVPNYLPSEVHGHVVGNQYCLIIDENQLDAVAAQRIVKCIDINKYVA
ncbi:uncharacterized protein LOC131670709 [Phymastichus coffea]|uniref:uncharacterized protein LOC131670709 n=1 Tax=Phymastichus coffea TaxID=108790 RepID=UPI00273C6150|nr:uncharacterized protein LOC131670709 [Phymastichus coffea]